MADIRFDNRVSKIRHSYLWRRNTFRVPPNIVGVDFYMDDHAKPVLLRRRMVCQHDNCEEGFVYYPKLKWFYKAYYCDEHSKRGLLQRITGWFHWLG